MRLLKNQLDQNQHLQEKRICSGWRATSYPCRRQQCPACTLTCHYCKKPGHCDLLWENQPLI